MGRAVRVPCVCRVVRCVVWSGCVLGEHEGDHVAKMEGLRRGAATGVEVEGLFGLRGIQDLIERSTHGT